MSQRVVRTVRRVCRLQRMAVAPARAPQAPPDLSQHHEAQAAQDYQGHDGQVHRRIVGIALQAVAEQGEAGVAKGAHRVEPGQGQGLQRGVVGREAGIQGGRAGPPPG